MARHGGAEPAEHVIGAEGMGDAPRPEQGRGRCRLEAVDDDGRRTPGEGPEDRRQPVGAAEGHQGAKRRIGLIEAVAARTALRVNGRRALHMNHQLGPPGRSRRGEQDRLGVRSGQVRRCGAGRRRVIGSGQDIDGDDGPVQQGCRLPGGRRARDAGPRLETGIGIGFGIGFGIQQADLHQRRQTATIEARDDAGEVDATKRLLGDQQTGPRQAEHVLEFGHAVAGVDGDRGRAAARQREIEHQPLDPIDQPERDAVAGTDALPFQPDRCLADGTVEVGHGPVAVTFGEGKSPGARPQSPRQQRAQRRCVHRHPPSRTSVPCRRQTVASLSSSSPAGNAIPTVAGRPGRRESRTRACNSRSDRSTRTAS